MARVCSICGKGSIMVGKRNLLRGQYNPTKSTKKYPNLQWLRLPTGKRVRACVKCIKNRAKTK
ncbi:TPA: 50S ribosomal protein L28 [Patescibacteria group bacterium]|nr:50S ribosomal protein L28 [Patescibacteria group bacterium]